MARTHRRTLQKELHNPDNHDDVITHLEPDNLECELKWALESISIQMVLPATNSSIKDGPPHDLHVLVLPLSHGELTFWGPRREH